VGQLIGTAVQFGISDLLSGAGHCDRLGRARGLFFEQLVDALDG
jgi:hypothetical protein